MKKQNSFVTVIIIILALLLIGSIFGSNKSDNSDDYERNVNKVADEYGKNPDDVNDAINRVVNEANN